MKLSSNAAPIFMKKIYEFIKKETVLVIAFALAILSSFWLPPNAGYIKYIDFRSLGILWSLMIIMQGLQDNDFFTQAGAVLLNRAKSVRQLSVILILLCFFSSMFITNDVALITFVPFSLLLLGQCNRQDAIIPIVVLQTMAANLGSMLTPIGNPQNLYLYGLSGMDLLPFLLCMLPYVGASFLLLMVTIPCIPGLRSKDKLPVVQLGHAGEKEETPLALTHEMRRRNLRLISYGILFAVALLTVLRVLEWWHLALLVLLVVSILQPAVLRRIDYALLFTFVGFFLFTGNLGQLSDVQKLLSNLLNGREIGVAVLASQAISNVPAALLLSGFTTCYDKLLIGVNLGGLGTLIASMASLISYKMVAHRHNEIKGKYFCVFTLVGVLYLMILLLLAYVLEG